MPFLPLSSLEQLYSQTCSHCQGLLPEAAADPDKLSELFKTDIKRLAVKLYNKKTGKIDLKLANKIAAVISQAILKGYAESYANLDFGTPDFEMYQNLQKQVYQFSFAKNYEQLKATTLALSQGNEVVPFKEFKAIAERINTEYNVRFLKTEYDTAIGSAQMASRWVQFQSEKKDLPYLTYQTVGDKRVRQTHQALNGVTRKVDDTFWQSYYPPNGWGCRCDVVQDPNGKETPKDKIVTPTDVPPLFKTNLAVTGMVYPPDHAYFEHVPDEVLKAADNQNPFIYNRVFKSEKESVWASPLHGKNEYKENLNVAKVLAKSGNRVILLPEIKPDTPSRLALRKMVLSNKTKEGKNPDATINGTIFDIKVLKAKSKSAVQHAVGDGSKQAEKLVIALPKGLGEKNFKRWAKGKLVQVKNPADEIWIVNNGKLKKFFTEDLVND